MTDAVETNPAIGALIRGVLASAAPTADTLELIAWELPYPSLALAETAVFVFGQLADMQDGDAGRHASWVLNLSNRLAELGRREEAIAGIEETITIRRALAQARPDAFLPELAISLNKLANVLAVLNRDLEAAAVRSEAKKLTRNP